MQLSSDDKIMKILMINILAMCSVLQPRKLPQVLIWYSRGNILVFSGRQPDHFPSVSHFRVISCGKPERGFAPRHSHTSRDNKQYRYGIASSGYCWKASSRR